MSVLEILANLFTVLSVVLTVYLKKSLYPVGIAATVLFFFVFRDAKLYASAGLQVWFTLIQLYGWWFWLRGDRGREPPISDWPWRIVALLGVVAALFTAVVSFGLYRFTDARTPVGDTAILALSVLAQVLLDRKQMKNWIVWAVADAASIAVYANQHLWLTTGVYTVLLANAAYGWLHWRKVLRLQAAS
ncbi:nicotinamide riboside transporter PnuC [Asticcacaulis solisilvae]|uniref:nicotinamide riboside transporter PnuC n=1 Tax=Asticcacaulis solisilvae TaxID=1217274 RepID=UPI003FD8A477